jgi:hypothetical protein
MKNILLTVLALLSFQLSAAAQRPEKYDIVAYTAPSGWEVSEDDNVRKFTKEGPADGIYCVIGLGKSLPANGDSKTNFTKAWTALVADTLGVTAEPQMGAPGAKNGWTTEVGLAPFEKEGLKGAAMLTTMTGGGKMVYVLVLTNSDSFEKDIEAFVDGMTLPHVDTAAAVAETGNTGKPSAEASRLVGKWNRSGSVHPTYADPVSWGMAGYTKSRYEFKGDGTYIFTERSFRMSNSTIILVKESGAYTVNGNQITIAPKKSVIEGYAKKGGVDELGPLIKSQNRGIETTTYNFTFHYFSGIQEWNLVLQAGQKTQRDGDFSNNTTFPNAWYFDQKYIDTDLTAPKAN